MSYIVRDWLKPEPLATVETVDDARNFCRQRLLKAWHLDGSDRGLHRFYDDLYEGIIQVYDARNTVYHSPGF